MQKNTKNIKHVNIDNKVLGIQYSSQYKFNKVNFVERKPSWKIHSIRGVCVLKTLKLYLKVEKYMIFLS